MSQNPQGPYQPPQSPLGYQPPGQQGGNGGAIAALVLGIVSIPGACLPIIGLPLGVIGLILGIKNKEGSSRGMAMGGLITSIIGLALSLINAAFGVYLALTGQHPLVNQ